MDREQEIRRFFLLQVNDALFPIGGYSHSQGLETYIQQGSVCDEKTAAEICERFGFSSYLTLNHESDRSK